MHRCTDEQITFSPDHPITRSPDVLQHELCIFRVSQTAYTRRHFDFLAAYIIPLDTWYVIPIAAFSPAKTICLAPHRPSRRRFEPFRGAWHLLRSTPETRRRGRKQ